MYFVISKALGFFSAPTNIILCLGLLGLVLIAARQRFGRPLTIATMVALVVAGLSPLGNMLLTPLEQRFPGLKQADRAVDGIIILGGSYDRVRGYLSTVLLDENSHALSAVAALAQRYPQ